MTIDRAISEYLSGSERRLTIPGFGTLIKRDEGGMVFLPLLAKNDGVLTNELCTRHDYTIDSANTAINDYVAQAKGILAMGKPVVLNGLGSIKRDANGKYEVVLSDRNSATQTEQPAEETPPAITVDIHPTYKAQLDAGQAPTEEPTQPEPKELRTARASKNPRVNSTAENPSRYLEADELPSDNTPNLTPQRPVSQEIAATKAESKAKAHEALDNWVSDDFNSPIQSRTQMEHDGKKKKKGGLDAVLIIAIIAIVLAIGVIVYGQLVERGYASTIKLGDWITQTIEHRQ